jgi:hypothetical protein
MKYNRNTSMGLLILLSFITCSANAQPAEPGYPASLFHKLSNVDLPIVNLPYFNNDELKAADTCETCSEAFGIDALAPFDFWKESQLEIISNNFEHVEIYRVKIKSPTANALHVIFEHFELGPNSKIYFYSPNDTARILGAYTINNNKPDLSFVSNRIFDNELIIEVNRRPKSSNETKGILLVKKFIHVYENRSDFEQSFNCHNNVICAPWYNEWCNQIRSVVKFYFRKIDDPHWWMCSGAIVNGGNGNFDPIILTAAHCVSNTTEHANWIVYFNYQSITCNPSTNGNDLMTVSGVNILSSDGSISVSCPDIALFRLRENIPLQYNVFHSGWSRSNLTYPQDGICIHHPAGDVKKISFGDITNPLFNDCHKVNWNSGLTQPGSSGSPLFTNSKLITGVNSHGPIDRSCDDLKYSMFSKIEQSWNILQPSLSPNNEDVVAILGDDPISACQPIINLNREFYPGNDWQVKNQITIQAANQVNVSNITETTIRNSDIFQYNPQHNSDYIIRAGMRIIIHPGFRINAPTRIGSSGIYTPVFDYGSQNRVRFQIAPCQPFIDECGYNHENAKVAPPKNYHSTDFEDNTNKKIFQLTIYPNPTNGALELNISSASKFTECMIYNTIGTLINSFVNLETSKNIIQIPIDNLANGIYFVQVISPDGIISIQKFVKN